MTTAAEKTPRRSGSRLGFLVPTTVTPWVRTTGLLSIIANAVLIVTGGLVRLTGSGLGCPTWPRCTADSWTNQPSMGLHGYIEFINRTLTGALMVVAILTFLAVVFQYRTHKDLWWLALLLGLGIPVQAVVGGFSVLLTLNPWMVGVHFMLSGIMTALSTVFWVRARRYSLPEVAEAEELASDRPSDRVERILGMLIGALTTIAVYMGTLVTGTGPHSGDVSSARHTFDAVTVTRSHTEPVWALLVLIVITFVLSARRGWAPIVRRNAMLVAAVMVLQGVIGYVQYFTGSPSGLVIFHMLGAALLIVAATMLFERMVVQGTPAMRQRAVEAMESQAAARA